MDAVKICEAIEYFISTHVLGIFAFIIVMGIIAGLNKEKRSPKNLQKMTEKEKKLRSYYLLCLGLIEDCEGKGLMGKVIKNKQEFKAELSKKIEDLLLKMIEIDEKSPYVAEIREKLYG